MRRIDVPERDEGHRGCFTHWRWCPPLWPGGRSVNGLGSTSISSSDFHLKLTRWRGQLSTRLRTETIKSFRMGHQTAPRGNGLCQWCPGLDSNQWLRGERLWILLGSALSCPGAENHPLLSLMIESRQLLLLFSLFLFLPFFCFWKLTPKFRSNRRWIWYLTWWKRSFNMLYAEYIKG